MLSKHRISSIIAIVLCLLAATPLHAQVVRGELVDRVTQQPVTSGFVVLIDSLQNELARGRVGRAGSFRLVAPGQGTYRIKTQIIGIRSTESAQFELRAGQVLEYRFEITAALVILPAIVVEDVRTCQTPAEAGLAASTLWEEARKALSAVAWTEGEALLRHKLVLYERERHPRTLDLLDERREEQTGLYRGSPFSTTDADALAERGYIQEVGDNEYYYYGPDAGVLLSDDFTSLHCFRPRPGLEDDALVGLQFEPIIGRDVSDIQGALWIDRHTFELRFLEFNYTQLPWAVDPGRVGGRIEFERLPDGPWIVARWWIRMPVVGYRQLKPIENPDYWSQFEVLAIQEVGGWVDEVYTRTGMPVPRVIGSTLVGRVTAADTNVSLGGVPVVLLGTGLEAPTDEAGRYRIDGIPEGDYYVAFDAEFLDSLGYVPPPLELSVTRQRSYEIDLRVLARDSAWVSVCTESDPAGTGFGIVTGFVRGLEGEPEADVNVVLSGVRRIVSGRDRFQEVPISVEGVTNAVGYYRICGVPTDVSLTAQALHRDRASAEKTVLLRSRAAVRLDLMLKWE